MLFVVLVLLSLYECQQTFKLKNDARTAYIFQDLGSNPTLTVPKGGSATFNVTAPGHPFWIKTV
jgi:hypothetical protein